MRSENLERNRSLKKYGLCPSHYLSAPGLSWDAMFNMTKVEIELILDADMYLFFNKKIMRGRIFYISKRYSKGNNKYLNIEIIYMIMWCPNFLLQGNLNGYILKSLIQTNIAAIVWKVVF